MIENMGSYYLYCAKEFSDRLNQEFKIISDRLNGKFFSEIRESYLRGSNDGVKEFRKFSLKILEENLKDHPCYNLLVKIFTEEDFGYNPGY